MLAPATKVGETPLPKVPEYEIYAICYARQDQRSEAHMFLGGDQGKLIQGLDFFTYLLRGGGRTWIVDTGMTERQAKRMGAITLSSAGRARRWRGSVSKPEPSPT